MNYYFAPMEGITGYLFRNAHQRYFGGVDKYYMPFFSPGSEHSFTTKSFFDVLPEHNIGMSVVPQLLTKRAPDFLWAAEELSRMGYREVNLNLGCPSGTVVAKGKGAGFLGTPEELDHFLEEVFSAVTLQVTVKTRLGMADPAEFERILAIYNQYPISELTIHPRVQKDFYKHPVRLEPFSQALQNCRVPVCYNGDLVTAGDCDAFSKRFPAVNAVMLGRGAIANPGLFRQLRGGPDPERQQVRDFHDELYTSYCDTFRSTHNAMCRMKELWSYLICLFDDRDGYAKKLRKVKDSRGYEALVSALFCDLPLLHEARTER